MTSIAIVEDNESIRRALRDWIDSSAEYRCVCACVTGKEALLEVPRIRPNVIVIDTHLAGESGISCVVRLKKRLPDVLVVVFTRHKDRDLICDAFKAGAHGYLLKPSSREEVLRGIAEAKAGGAPMSGEIARRVVEMFQHPTSQAVEIHVSSREKEVLDLLAKGLSNKQIAAQLGISYDTVCVHLRHIYGKLNVRSRTAAAIWHLSAQPDRKYLDWGTYLGKRERV